MLTFTDMPEAIASLPRDSRGYPIPWFVAEIDGIRDFRIADQAKWRRAVMDRLCWVCGGPIPAGQDVFVIGPMCGLNRTTAEPSCHADCARFSAKNCPFLAKPKAVRREANMPGGTIDPAGMMIARNPGVALLWFCRGYQLFSDGRGGQLFQLPHPSRVEWYAEGRLATRREVMESIDSGLPILQDIARREGVAAFSELASRQISLMKLLPKASRQEAVF